jgi:hypothetical protein
MVLVNIGSAMLLTIRDGGPLIFHSLQVQQLIEVDVTLETMSDLLDITFLSASCFQSVLSEFLQLPQPTHLEKTSHKCGRFILAFVFA